MAASGANIFFESPYAVIYWDLKLQAVRINLRGFAQNAAFREAHQKALELLKLKQASRWLVDLTEQGVVSLADQDWLVSDWLPQAIQIGLKDMALVLPKSQVAQLATYRISRQVPQITHFPKSFETLEAAEQWLLTKL